jgi:hypothetical protein
MRQVVVPVMAEPPFVTVKTAESPTHLPETETLDLSQSGLFPPPAPPPKPVVVHADKIVTAMASIAMETINVLFILISFTFFAVAK